MEFEWALSKELENLRKHGVTFSEAVESFLDPQGFQLVDAKHSVREKRFFWVGRLSTGRQDSHLWISRLAEVSEVIR